MLYTDHAKDHTLHGLCSKQYSISFSFLMPSALEYIYSHPNLRQSSWGWSNFTFEVLQDGRRYRKKYWEIPLLRMYSWKKWRLISGGTIFMVGSSWVIVGQRLEVIVMDPKFLHLEQWRTGPWLFRGISWGWYYPVHYRDYVNQPS